VVHLASGREWRGGQRQVWLLARELHEMGVPQKVITGRGSELARRLTAAGVPLRAVGWRIGLDPRVLPAVLRELRPTGSLLHAHDAHALSLGGLGAALAGRDLIVTRRTIFPLRHPGFWKGARHVIAVSEAAARSLAGHGLPPERISVIHSATDLDPDQRPQPLGMRARLGLAPSTLLAVSVAALTAEKDQATLIRAAHALRDRLPDLHWVVAGEGDQRPALTAQARGLGVGDRVHLPGHLDDPARLIAEATVFVMSSQQEGLGTSVLDALALGIPVASTTAGGLPELLAGGSGILVPPGDPAAMAEAVRRILTDPEAARALADRGRSTARRLTPRRMAEQVRSVYRSCGPFP
jgi:glycosyltransferase involved in cell wall biosynthesis